MYKTWCDKNNFKVDITTNGFGQKLSRMIKEDCKFVIKSPSHHISSYYIDFAQYTIWINNINPCLINEN